MGELSVAAHTVPRVIHPWRRFRALAHIELRWHDKHDSDGNLADFGYTDFDDNAISLRRDLDQAGRRSTILHECLHAERGPSLDDPALIAREEMRVSREAARMLLPDVRAIGEALAWAHSLAEAAFELWVDEDTLRDRLDNLHPAELHYLRQRLEHAETR